MSSIPADAKTCSHNFNAPSYLGRKVLSGHPDTRKTHNLHSRELQDNVAASPHKIYRRFIFPKGFELVVPAHEMMYGDFTKYAYIRAIGYNALTTTDAIVVVSQIGAIVGAINHQPPLHRNGHDARSLHTLQHLLTQHAPWDKAIIFKYCDELWPHGMGLDFHYELIRQILRAAGVRNQNIHERLYEGGKVGGMLVVTKAGKVYMRKKRILALGW